MNGLLTPPELEALRLSLDVAARSVLLSLPLAILIAWLLARARLPGRTLFDAFVHLPLVLPPVAVGYVLLLLFGARGPLGGWLQRHFGIELAFTTAGAALATAVMTLPAHGAFGAPVAGGHRPGTRGSRPHARGDGRWIAFSP